MAIKKVLSLLTRNDNKLINNLIASNVITLKDSSLEQLLYYEKKYNLNTLDVIYSSENDNQDFVKWRELGLEFIRINGDIRLINKITPIKFFGITIQPKIISKAMIDVIVNHYANSAIVISSKNTLYKKIISFLNSNRKIVILFTNNPEDFNLNFSNLIVVYSEKPNQEVADFSDWIMLSKSDLNSPLNFKYRNKLLYI